MTVEQYEVTPPINALSEQNLPTEGLSVAGFLLKQLERWGVRRIYGVIGDANLQLLDELSRNPAIRYVACRQENAAALMASAEAKLTGRIGVCLATSGPGAASLVNGLGDAWSDRAPVLAITGQVETRKMGTRTKQYINQQALMSPVALRSELLAHPDALPTLLRELMAEALSRGGVVHLGIPKDLFTQPVRGVTVPYADSLRQPGAAAPEELLRQAAALAAKAARPVLFVGRGAAAAAAELPALAERLSAPVVTTLPAKGVFPSEHPLFAGGLGPAGSEAASVLMGESDLILALGATWWPEDYAPVTAKVVRIDLAKENLAASELTHLGIVGDLAQCIPELMRLLPADQPDRSGWKERAVEVNRNWNERIRQEVAQEGTPIPPQRVMQIISDCADEDAVICVDTGDHTVWFNRNFRARRQDILVSGRWRTLGFALPAAIAAQSEFPDRQVIAIAGDGGVVQTLMELGTAAQHGLPIVVIVINNGSYAMERNRMKVEHLNTLGSGLHNPDFTALDRALGGTGYRASDASGFEQVVREALQARIPAVIDVLTAGTLVPHTKI